MADFIWTTGGESMISHVHKIASGAFGEVHMVFHLIFWEY